MATQKKGCGFLISALVLFLLAIGAIVYGISGAAGLVDDFKSVKTFTTPTKGEFTSTGDSSVTIWLVGNEETVPGDIEINVVNQSSKAFVPSALASNEGMKARMGNRLLIGQFQTEPDTTYSIEVKGLAEGREISLSNISTDAAVGAVKQGAIGVLGAGIFGVVGLVLGIIGLVKFFGSKKEATA